MIELPKDHSSETSDQFKLEIYSSGSFPNWLENINASIAFTTYQVGKLIFLGLKEGKLLAHERTYPQCQGLWTDGEDVWVSSLFQLWHLKNSLKPGEIHESGVDRNFVPRQSYVTGRLDIHDIGIDKKNRPIFVNTRFNCISGVDENHSFKVLWKPPFISKIFSEDRCHLNGMAMKNGSPVYVTAISKSDVLDGWRDRRNDGGIVIDVKSGEIVASGLSMPHSPRLYKNKLWLLNSGTGEFGFIDLKKSGQFQPLTFCPGYARGLSFIGDYALIGLSLPRDVNNKTFTGLALDDRLKNKDTPARCGLIVVDLKTGNIIEWLRIEGMVKELYDVAILPRSTRARAVSLQKFDEISGIVNYRE